MAPIFIVPSLEGALLVWQVLHPKVFQFEGQFVDYYIQWDDPWLLTVLRAA